MKWFILLAITVMICPKIRKPRTPPKIVNNKSINKPISKDYDVTKANIKKEINLFKQENSNPKTLQQRFVQIMVDSIFPYWYGTRWDFNGITQVPRKGSIACGYFVSTTIQDAGYDLNRCKIGQLSSGEIINTLIKTNKKTILIEKPLDIFLQKVNMQGYGLYIVGLDCHVGFLFHDGKDIYFIHSKYYGERSVVKELAKTSGILFHSKYREFAKLSDDEVFLRKWGKD